MKVEVVSGAGGGDLVLRCDMSIADLKRHAVKEDGLRKLCHDGCPFCGGYMSEFLPAKWRCLDCGFKAEWFPFV